MTMIRTALVCCVALVAVACGSDEVIVDENTESITTNFGDAVATSERTEFGDISTWLTNPDSTELLGELSFIADSGLFSGQVMTEVVPFDAAMDMSTISLDDLNQLLHTLWEIERDDPIGVTCTQNAVAICCRDNGWSCSATQR